MLLLVGLCILATVYEGFTYLVCKLKCDGYHDGQWETIPVFSNNGKYVCGYSNHKPDTTGKFIGHVNIGLVLLFIRKGHVQPQPALWEDWGLRLVSVKKVKTHLLNN